jgi:hypothetical protein
LGAHAELRDLVKSCCGHVFAFLHKALRVLPLCGEG